MNECSELISNGNCFQFQWEAEERRWKTRTTCFRLFGFICFCLFYHEVKLGKLEKLFLI